MRPRVFIGSSSETLHVAEEIQLKLSSVANISVWTDNIFRISEYFCESLLRQLDNTDYAIFILGADDIANVRNIQGLVPRDNVLFELGLFAGRLGLKKVFIVHPKLENLRLPTDLLGVTTIQYLSNDDESISCALAPACTILKKEIGDARDRHVSWAEYSAHINAIINQLKKTAGRGGFSFDTCVGISRGGIIAADLIARHYGMNIPVVCLWADLHVAHPATTFDPPENWINRHILDILSQKSIRNILLVNDISRSGKSVELAIDFLKSNLGDKCIKSAVLIVDTKKFDHVDFYAIKDDTSCLQLPYYGLG